MNSKKQILCGLLLAALFTSTLQAMEIPNPGPLNPDEIENAQKIMHERREQERRETLRKHQDAIDSILITKEGPITEVDEEYVSTRPILYHIKNSAFNPKNQGIDIDEWNMIQAEYDDKHKYGQILSGPNGKPAVRVSASSYLRPSISY